ncbi:hypothetical protein AWZ03_000009 [Drosophila navojoa]|uniref:HMG box domain-containing protein n=1 Tax=Drosophila navojoa TaxID=7232 RepID=A0A484BWZ3_DRONA|nr:hypothetical protein AWZ03_000009 [Drosophila navojoa]
MAKSGYCSNEQLIKLAQKHYKNQLDVVFTPFMMYMEEYLEYLQEHAMDQDYSMDEIVHMARHNWKKFKKFEKVRYKELAELANSQ